MTIVGKETTHEILKKDKEFCFREGTETQLPMNHILSNVPDFMRNAKIIKEFAIGKLRYLMSRLQKNIDKAIDLYIGDCVEPKIIHDPSKTVADIIAIPITNIIVGEVCIICVFFFISENFICCYKSMAAAGKNFLMYRIPLRFGWNPISKHRKIIISRIKPIIEKRLYDKKKLGDAWIVPVDALQYYLDNPEITPDLDPNNVNYDHIVDALGDFVFAAMGTTTNGATRSLYELVERKQYWNELYEEAQEINKQCNGNELTSDDIAKIVKLNSFVKEALRFSKGIVGLPHRCVSKSYYTFENGYQIPSGRIVMLNFIDTHYDEGLQGQNPKEFYAYRHLERSSTTKIDRNFLGFGGGKHACPGRSLAVNEIKVFLYKILLKYNARTEIEIIEPQRNHVGPLADCLKGGMVFENRKEIIN
ncbi:cytochrome P450 [Gigaspora rosea]|uniref:Cytochrome P450 n=1 Tax=Gigaspora rosea TaxID=44941 RepID=A0A397VT21_9GLOM|nr:cytochrome P450 [Gigaspora rosea]